MATKKQTGWRRAASVAGTLVAVAAIVLAVLGIHRFGVFWQVVGSLGVAALWTLVGAVIDLRELLEHLYCQSCGDGLVDRRKLMKWKTIAEATEEEDDEA